MFSFRRKPKKEDDSSAVRTSPSLPELASQGIPWPESLVDVAAIRDAPQPETPHQGAAPTSLEGIRNAPIPFHKPFRRLPGKPSAGAPISSLYMSTVPSAFENGNIPATKRYSQRRARIPPTFNMMVVGGQRTGKSSLLRLLLETADISPSATVDQRAAVDRFLRGGPKPTQSIETACIEICESRFDKILLSVIDTPGLEFSEGRELKLERQVNSMLKYIDAQYADTMSEESKVVRKSKGDQHIHLCIYLIDPASIITVANRRALSSLPTKTRSETTVSNRSPPELVPDTSSVEDSDDEDEGPLTMSPGEIRVIRKLSARVNVLPVVAHADSLTDDKLNKVKQAIRTGLSEAGLDFGVFGMPKDASIQNTPAATPAKRKTRFANGNGNGNANGTNGEKVDQGAGHNEDDEGDEGEDEEERQARPVIKLRPKRHPRNLSRSRSRRDLSQAADDDRRPQSPDPTEETVANVRFSAHVIAKMDITGLMPFALIAPEAKKRRHRPFASDNGVPHTPASPVPASEDGHAPSIDAPSVQSSKHAFPIPGPPEDLKGVFLRKFRWGTVDVLDPNHCDFAALRTAVLSTHLKVLKTHTKEVLYEKYRTEKLLARRATRQITEDERQRLLEDLGI